ncbi:TonB-linked outer membrane protein, SusC/RagA family [bacterium A37T11]|nr:TonB-linked outer membrane protein, SusC/RagA family [bacterium A37T11]
MYKINWLLLFSCIFMSGIGFAQEKPVSGKVHDSRGGAIEGATIRIKGNGRALTLTDATGGFYLQVPVNATLQVTSLGYSPREITIGTTNFYEVVLQEYSNTLDTLLITTALGIRREKSQLPYAAQQVNAADLNRTPANNFIQNLAGKVAGLQVSSNSTLGGTNNVILRGFKSLTQSNQALFVVDGVPIDNTNQSRNGLDLGNAASDINIDDIASINVLKGAAASALYGSRAANGVILINTKKGPSKKGTVDIVLDQSLQTGSIDQSTLPEYQTKYGQGRGTAGKNAAYPDQSGWFYYTPAIGSGGQPVPVVITNEDLAWGPAYDASLSVYNWDSFVPGNPNYGKATPWVAASNNKASDYFQTPFSSNTSLLVIGSQERSFFKLGYTNNYEKGIAPNSYIKKNVFNFGGSYDISTKLTVGAAINYTNALANNRSSYDYRAANSNVRDLRQWFPSSVNLDAQRADYNRGYNASWNIIAGSYANESGNIIKAAYHNNPYWNDYENYNNDTRERYFGNVYGTYDIVKGLTATGRISRDSYTQFFENRIAVGSYQTSSYARTDVKYAETNYDFLLNLDRNLDESFNLKALLGTNIRRTHTQSIGSTTSGGLVVPGLYAISNSVSAPAAPLEYDGIKQVNGFFAGVTLTYRDFLALDATGRTDRSSALPKDHASYFYPAVSGSFTFSKLLPEASWLSFGKFRVNYAEVGSDAPIYSIQNTYVAGTPFNGQNIYSNPLTNNNPDLRPERNQTYEAGLEAAVLNNRISLDLTYYHSRLKNQITPITPSTATGYSNFYVNGGTIQNKGWEVVLNLVPVKNTNFTYELTLNWSKNENKVLSLYGSQPSYTIASYQNAIQLAAEVGQPYGTIRGTDYTYLNGKRLVDANGYYVKSDNRNADLGNITPDWIGGLTNRFNYKEFSLSFLIDASHGGNVYSLDNDNASRAGILKETAANNDLGNPLRNPLSEGGGVILDGVKADGTPNDIRIDASDVKVLGSKLPFGSTNVLAAKSYVYDASYIKLREVAIAYALPGRLFSEASKIKGVTFALSGRNLWIIQKNLPYADPEQGAPSTTLTSSAPMIYNANASIGYQNGVFPTVRQFALNVRVNF